MARPDRSLVPDEARAAALAQGFDDALTAALSILPRCGGCAASRRAPRRLISAVSGGPDSMALARLAGDYAARAGAVHGALVVDHGIRPDSAAEAARVGARLGALGIAARVLTVSDLAPASGLQEWARNRRYERLLDEARKAGACLLLGHHGGDQAETVMMRLARGSGLAGLAGMRGVTLRHGVPVLRPLLHADRDAIAGYCARLGLAFETDPGNEDSRFDRVRCRRALTRMNMAGLAVPAQLNRLATLAGAIDDSLLRALHIHGLPSRPGAAGQAVLPPGLLALAPLARSRALAWVIRLVASPPHGPSQDSLRRLGARLAEGRASTLGGARFAPADDGWLVTAEIGRSPPRRSVAAGDRVLFAGTWLVHSPVDAVIRHLGQAGSGAHKAAHKGGQKGGQTGTGGQAGDGAALPWRDSDGWRALPPLVRRSLPVLETLDGRLLYPHLVSHGQAARSDAVATAECLRHTGASLEA